VKTLCAGIIGLGVGEEHIKGYASHAHAMVTAVCDIDAARLREVGERHPQVETTRSPERILADPAIDVVSIASYDDAHASQILSAIEHGKHVFAEKPLCLTESDARAIRAALRNRPGTRLCSNLVLRCAPRYQAVRELVQRGELGTLFHMEGDYLYGRLPKLVDGWRGRTPGYSVTLGGAIHMIDLLLWISSDRVVEVFALGNRVASQAAGSGFAGADMAVALLQFASGCVGKVSANFGCVMPHAHQFQLFGTAGTISNSLDAARLCRSRQAGDAAEVIALAGRGSHKGAGIASFLDSILYGRPPFISEEEVFAAMAVCFAIDRSLQSGQPERVADLWS
jgi:predicted dehydrogenase